MVKKLVPVPTRTDYQFKTRYKQDRKTGLLLGRDSVKGYGDYTPVKRVSRDVDVDRDGTIDAKKGEIWGRESKEKGITYVKGSKRQRGYTR